MSGRLVGEVLDHAPQDLTPAARLVLIALAADARDTDRIARFKSSVDALAYRTNLAPGSIRNVLSELVARGLIRPLIKHVHRGGKHQEYELAKLANHHRFATINGTSHDDANRTEHVNDR